VVVGQNEDPFALVGSANGGSGEHTPLRIEPAGGKVSKDELEASSRNKSAHVFEEAKWRFDF
jgi:hypothetical protein